MLVKYIFSLFKSKKVSDFTLGYNYAESMFNDYGKKGISYIIDQFSDSDQHCDFESGCFSFIESTETENLLTPVMNRNSNGTSTSTNY